MRIVLMSGYADEVDEEGASALPILTKPFVRQDMARALQRANKGKS
jgi:FixJ family two-component response regulator